MTGEARTPQEGMNWNKFGHLGIQPVAQEGSALVETQTWREPNVETQGERLRFRLRLRLAWRVLVGRNVTYTQDPNVIKGNYIVKERGGWPT